MVLDERGLSDDSLRGSEPAHFRADPNGPAGPDAVVEPTSVQERAAADRLGRTALGFMMAYQPGLRQPTSPGSGQASAEPSPGADVALPKPPDYDPRQITPANRPAIMPDVQYQTEVKSPNPRLGNVEFYERLTTPDEGPHPADIESERGAPPENPPYSTRHYVGTDRPHSLREAGATEPDRGTPPARNAPTPPTPPATNPEPGPSVPPAQTPTDRGLG